jgi:ferredoxin
LHSEVPDELRTEAAVGARACPVAAIMIDQ